MSFADKIQVTRIFIPAMDCPDEEREVRAALGRVGGVLELTFHLFFRQVEVRHRGGVDEILSALRKIGMEGHVVGGALRRADIPESGKAPLRAFFVCAALLLCGAAARFYAPELPWAGRAFLLTAAAGGLPVAWRGLRELRNRSLGMNALMTISIFGAAAMGETAEAAAVVTLFALATYLEARSLDAARRATASLFSASPQAAVVRVGGVEGTERTVPATEVRPGDILIIRPGERVPVDALVRKGASDLDEAVLTGEAAPVAKSEGDPLYAGTVNGRGLLIAEALRPLTDSTFARILRRVEGAQREKAPIQSFMERFAAAYTPAVLAAAAAVAFIPPLVGGRPAGPWAYRGLVLLVIACPCAIVLAAPVAALAALTRAARAGILVKGARHLEALGGIRAVAFDKTGTLTRGRLRVTRVVPLEGAGEEDVIRLAAAVEAGSAHPAAEAIRHEAKRRNMARPARGTLARTFSVLEGRGVAAEFEGERVFVGNRRLFEEIGAMSPSLAAALPQQDDGLWRTVSIVGRAGRPTGFIELSDEPRPEAREAVAALRAMGIGRIVVLTGDRAEPARRAAEATGIDEVFPELLPDEKMDMIREISAAHGGVAMVGDGVNDAPALALATVGVAMGAAGSPAAIETADVALMAEDLRKIPEAIQIGRAMVFVIRQNVAASLLVKAAFVGLAAAGYATLWMAVAADMGTTLAVVFNGLRLLRAKPTAKEHSWRS